MTDALSWLAPPQAGSDGPAVGLDLPTPLALRRLVQAADENIETLTIVGWCRAAVDILAAEPRLRGRKIYWIIAKADVPALEACFPPRGPEPGFAVCGAAVGEMAEIAQAFAAIGSVFSLAVMSNDPDFIFRLQVMRVDNFVRQTRSFERAIGDYRHLLQRMQQSDSVALVESHAGIHAGATAVCVAAGPGLDLCLDLLRTIAKDCVIICVDVAFARLVEAGIPCHYVLNVDSHPGAALRLRSTVEHHATLVMPIEGFGGVDQWFDQTLYFVPPHLIPLLFDSGLNDFRRGTNVGAAAVGWAYHLGCTEIVLLGHDLSYGEGCMYSTLVVDHEKHSRDMKAEAGQIFMIPGNNGSEVMTEHTLKVACDDLAALIADQRDKARVYNYNINLQHGAVIRNTERLPEGWQPKRVDIVHHRAPQQKMRLTRSELIETTSRQIDSLVGFWRDGRGRGTDVLTMLLELHDRSDLRVASHLLLPALTGHILTLVRLAAMPSSSSSGGAVRSASEMCDALLARWQELVQGWIRGGDGYPPPPELAEPGLAFLRELAYMAPRLRSDSLESAIIPMLARERMSVRRHFPDVELPQLPFADEACHVLGRAGLHTAPLDLVQLLCMASLEGDRFKDVTLLACKHGLLSEPKVCGANLADWLRTSAPAIIAAHDGLIALLPDATCPSREQLAAIAAWPPTHIHLVYALLPPKRDRQRQEALFELIDAGAIPLDDAIVAAIITLHPDVLEAIHRLGSKMAATGVCTELAIGKRLLDIGDWNGAQPHFARIGTIGRCAEDRLFLESQFLARQNRTEPMIERLVAWPDREMASRVLFHILRAGFGGVRAMEMMDGFPQAALNPEAVGQALLAVMREGGPVTGTYAAVVRKLLATWAADGRDERERQQAEEMLLVLDRVMAGSQPTG